MESWIRRACRNAAYRRLALSVALVALCLAACIGNRQYLANCLHGPYNATSSELLSRPDIEPGQEFLTIHGNSAYETGVDEITIHKTNGVETSREKTSSFYALVIDGRPLLVKSVDGGLTQTGKLTEIPDKVAAKLFDGEDPSLRAKFYPYMLDAAENYRNGAYMGSVVTAAIVSLSLFIAYRAWKIIRDVSLDSTVRRIESRADWINLCVASENEMRTAIQYKISGITVTRNFIVVQRLLSFDMFLLSDLLWIYEKVTQHRVNFVPTRRTFDVVLVFKYGRVEIPARSQSVRTVIEAFTARVPWAITGYDTEIARLARFDMAKLLAIVSDRLRTVAGATY